MVDLLQVRGKELAAGDLETVARRCVARLKDLPTAVIVNDRLDVAFAAGADGAHLGQEDLPVEAARKSVPDEFLIGSSAHGPEELRVAEAAGADYAGLGAFFATRTKPGARLLDRRRAGWRTGWTEPGIPVLGIGGVTAARVADVFRTRAVTGVAVGAAIQSAADPGQAILGVRAALERAWLARLERIDAR